MSKKSAKIAGLIESCRGKDLDAHYLGYFECFNRGLFYESHDVLEELWLPDRRGPDGNFYKGLIQLAGAFVLMEKDRLHPAARLFKLSRGNLQQYPAIHQKLDLKLVLTLIAEWIERLEGTNFATNPLKTTKAPKLSLLNEEPDRL